MEFGNVMLFANNTEYKNKVFHPFPFGAKDVQEKTNFALDFGTFYEQNIQTSKCSKKDVLK